ncbi:MAG: TonB family protein [Pseudoduganella sp.]|jgi:TonB family protein|nr:TonB family protein [Pseudoduganella sp.]
MNLMKTVSALLAGFALLPLQAQDAADGVGRSDQSAQKKITVNFKTCPKPVWPKEALRREQTGKVTLEFLIGLDGKVLESTVLKSSGHPLLDLAAQDGLAKCEFTPPASVGRSEPTRTQVQYIWTLAGSAKSAEQVKAEWQRILAAAEQGEAKAQWQAAGSYLAGRKGVVEQDAAAGIRWLRAAANQDYAPALEALAMQHKAGKHVERDPQQAFALLEKAAALGSTSARLGLATYLMQGNDIPRDEARAQELLEDVVASGNVRGKPMLALLLMKQGDGNGSRVLQLLQEAADAQDRFGQFMLAAAYEKGDIVAQDKAKALALYERAAAGGFAPAQQGLQRLKPAAGVPAQ